MGLSNDSPARGWADMVVGGGVFPQLLCITLLLAALRAPGSSRPCSWSPTQGHSLAGGVGMPLKTSRNTKVPLATEVHLNVIN